MADSVNLWEPMTEEQRARWKETRLFPVEQWNACADAATPLVCPTPTIEELRSLASSVPEHIQASGWYIGKAAFGRQYLYADNFQGMGRQWVCYFPAGKRYFGSLAEYVAALHPRTIVRLLDRIVELEKLATQLSQLSADQRAAKFAGCKYSLGQHIIPRHVLRGANAEHATVWKITGVDRHQHEPRYWCTAPGYGAIGVYESDIHVTDKPVSCFPKGDRAANEGGQ